MDTSTVTTHNTAHPKPRGRQPLGRPPAAEPLVMTNNRASALLDSAEFELRLTALKGLLADVNDAINATVDRLLTFAVEYAALYETVKRDSARVRQVNEALCL